MGIRRAGTSENRLIREEKLYEKDRRMPQVRGTDIVKVPGTASGSGRFCCNEVPLGILDAAPVDRFVCCTCGYSEEWLRKSNLDDIRERWAKKPK